MNLADDFFKAKRQADKLTAELERKSGSFMECAMI